jgi:UDP-galactopyranose mutase
MEIYRKYHSLARTMTNTYFTGRLATYRYYNMDQVVAQSLSLFEKITQSQAENHVNGAAVYQKA